MSTDQQLAELFDEQARQAPSPDALLDGAMRKVRTRRRRIAAAVGGTAVLGAAVLLTAGMNLGVGAGAGAPVAGPSPSGTVPAGKAGSPITVTGISASCVYDYSPELIAEKLDFALDGTVVSVGDPVSQRPGDPVLDYVGVTFRVNEWFRGGSGDTITVDLPPSGYTSAEGDGSPSAYAPGTRLLVSGMDRWGDTDGPLRYPIGWFGCGGFTRYYSESVANSWRAANR